MFSKRLIALVAIVAATFCAACGSSTRADGKDTGAAAIQNPTGPKTGGEKMSFSIESSVFEHEGPIPARYTCEGEDVSVPLSWSGAPEGTKSLALIMDDPDAPDPKAPKMVWVHWVLYNLPAGSAGLPEGVSQLPTGTGEGLNDWKRTGYGGPCPPIGTHRYFHKLYALDTVLPDLNQPTKEDLLEAMEGHILAETVVMGTYIKAK